MKSVSIASSRALSGTGKPTILAHLARRALLRRLAGLEVGRLVITDGHDRRVFGESSSGAALSAHITVHDRRFYSDVAFGGSIGAGEAYMHGHWSCDDLTQVIRLFLQNRDVLYGIEAGIGRFTEPMHKFFHWINWNSRRGSERNIAAHYDLGNEFFRLWLDESMMYSAAVYEGPNMTLEEASRAKLDRICRKLDLCPEDHVMEIGTGWGGFAVYAAREYGCRVTTTTISRDQHEYASQLVAEAGLTEKVTLLRKDYRDLQGQFSKLVSIEMVEAIGHKFLDTYFHQCSRLLRPEGLMLLQAITIAEQHYERARRSVDFIQRYIFPGGSLHSLKRIVESIARATDMRLYHLEEIGPHYARTLRDWRDRLSAKLAQVRRLGYPEDFIRMWEFYFCYCEGGFIERDIGDAQILLGRPASRRPAIESQQFELCSE